MVVSIRDVAERAGVSMATVSNTLNNPARVSKRSRAKVLKAIDELGYVRNESAYALRVGRNRSSEIGLLVTSLTNPFFADLAEGADRAAEEIGDVVTMCCSNGSRTREIMQLQRMVSQHVKGILLNAIDLDDADLDFLVDSGVPVVIVARSAMGRPHCSVFTDDVRGGENAIAHLIELGHRRIAFVGADRFPDRRRGARLAIASHSGPEVDMSEFDAFPTQEGGRRVGDRIAAMTKSDRPTGVACGNDLVALGVLQAMTRAGILVPEELAIVGYDDIPYAAGAAVPLTTIEQPREELGRGAFRLLLDEIAEKDRHKHRDIVFAPRLVVRTSTVREPTES